MELLSFAQEYLSQGLSVIATSDKEPVVPWKCFQNSLPSLSELDYMFSRPWTNGIAIVTGKASGNLEVIDVDVKYDLTGSLFGDLILSLNSIIPDTLQQLVIARTKSGGYHLLYRCDSIGPNRWLARRNATQDELLDNPDDRLRVLVETRGQGGYIVVYPSPGYSLIQGSLAEIPCISIEDRFQLMQSCISFNQVRSKDRSLQIKSQTTSRSAGSPFSDYNERGDVVGLLLAHGWKIVDFRDNKTIFLRPGNTTSKSSGDYHHGLGLFTVFSTSTIFEPLRGYRPATLFAILECNNDYSLAASKLIQLGYGKPRRKYRK